MCGVSSSNGLIGASRHTTLENEKCPHLSTWARWSLLDEILELGAN